MKWLSLWLFVTASLLPVNSTVTGDTQHRKLPGIWEELRLQERLENLFSTPINDWEGSQWILAAMLLLLVLWCCGCLAGNRRRYYRGGGGYYGGGGNMYGGAPYGGGYGYGNSNGGGGSCLRNVLLCACCYEICCADCQHVQGLLNRGGGNEYRREGDVV